MMESVCGSAHIRVLVIPASDNWPRSKFLSYVDRLRSVLEVRLVDITPIADSHFNPQRFPQGKLFFDIQTNLQDESSMLFLYDFEPYRKTFVVIGLCEGSPVEEDAKERLHILEQKYPNSISHCLIYEDSFREKGAFCNVFGFGTSTETIMCDVGRIFLQALSHYYSSYKHVTLRSPGAIGGNSVVKTTFVCKPVNSVKRLSGSLESNSSMGKKSSMKNGAISASSGSDKSQQRAKARQLKILANFQLLAGQYIDSLANFSEAASIAHKIHDYLWLGSSLEGVAISMILLSYLNVQFQIPAIVTLMCPSKSITASTNTSPSQRSSTSSNGNTTFGSHQSPRSSNSGVASTPFNSNETLLGNVLKAINDKILHYYELSLSHSIEYTPQVVYCQNLLRILRFMCECSTGSFLSESVLNSVVLGISQNYERCESMDPCLYSKMEIYQLSNRFFELQLKYLDISMQIRLYLGLASIYKVLEFSRKRAFVIRKLLSSLLTHLDQVPWCSEYDILVDDILETYDIKSWTPESNTSDAREIKWFTLQKNVLMLLINVAQKTNKNDDVIRFSKWAITRYSHLLTQIEEANLVKSILAPAENSKEKVEYWDPFILRKVRLIKTDHDKEIPIRKVIENGKTIDLNDDQVFNPFKDANLAAVERPQNWCNTFLVSETAELSFSVQNPFKCNLEITSLSFCDEDAKIMKLLTNDITNESPIIVKPGNIRTIHYPIVFINETTSIYKITHLKIGVFQLPAREYPICQLEQINPAFDQRADLGEYCFSVIQEQPQLEVLSSSLPNYSCMALEGSKKQFTLKIHNSSLSKAANYLMISSTTNVEKQLKHDYWRNTMADELHDTELQLKLLHENFIRVLNLPTEVKPNEVLNIDIEIDITNATLELEQFEIIFTYGCRGEDNSVAFIKQLSIPFNITIKRSVEITNMEIISLHEELPDSIHIDWIRYVKQECAEHDLTFSDFALMLLDVRNSWINKTTLRLGYDSFKADEHVLGTYHSRRLIIPIKKIGFDTKFEKKPIPAIVTGRQFVHSGLTKGQEQELRIKFWCREYILSRLKCQWEINSDIGSVDFRSFIPKLDDSFINIIYRGGRTPYKLELTTPKSKVSIGEEISIQANIDSGELTSINKYISVQFQFFERRTGKPIPESNKILLYNGTLTKSINLKTSNKIELKVMPIERGEYEFQSHIVGTETTAYYFLHVI
ncbi:TRAPPII-specific subunit TRS120 Ecym_5457 [Eremothecium cymbalariae DBVPG|uniref:Uncharacterized protein n=1 Tax=Eremothecium cymbalariae (strain CBS 270.75 / DBVPG 7215 / KCTC 17166 / NRRL Y-17582) TaxID=931890 RepID=I6NDR4_ERECY|nr:hypothetical protein Ecym_5457 [Eremothecium cymbalariae DBVPG\